MINIVCGARVTVPLELASWGEAIITGVSFLGAGTIIRHRGTERVEGITTAASLLMMAAIGATIGLAPWFLGVAMTEIVFLVLRLSRALKITANGPSSGEPPEKTEEKPL